MMKVSKRLKQSPSSEITAQNLKKVRKDLNQGILKPTENKNLLQGHDGKDSNLLNNKKNELQISIEDSLETSTEQKFSVEKTISSGETSSNLPKILNSTNHAIIGVISDTHGVLDASAISILSKSTQIIIHAGDVGDVCRKKRLNAETIIKEIEEKTNKKVEAVYGNVDEKCTWAHVCGFPPHHSLTVVRLVSEIHPDIIVFGHSHIPGVEIHDRILYLNPGSAGPRRFRLPRCLSLLRVLPCGSMAVTFHSISEPLKDKNMPPDFFSPCQSKNCASCT